MNLKIRANMSNSEGNPGRKGKANTSSLKTLRGFWGDLPKWAQGLLIAGAMIVTIYIAFELHTALREQFPIGSGGYSAAKKICEPYEKQCNGDLIVRCGPSGIGWELVKICQNGCFGGQCKIATKVIKAEIDTFVDFSLEGENFGGEKTLKVYDSTGGFLVDETISYLRLDMSDIPIDAYVESAKLRLYANNVDEAYRVGLHYCSDVLWDEFEMTWNNRPEFTEKPEDVIKVVTEDDWHEWNVTELAKMFRGNHLTVALKSVDVHKQFAYVTFLSTDQTEKEMQDKAPHLIASYRA
jgi:hypothetical protein